MSANPHLDGVLIEWGERLFYPRNRIVQSNTPKLQSRLGSMPGRVAEIRARIEGVRLAEAALGLDGG